MVLLKSCLLDPRFSLKAHKAKYTSIEDVEVAEEALKLEVVQVLLGKIGEQMLFSKISSMLINDFLIFSVNLTRALGAVIESSILNEIVQ